MPDAHHRHRVSVEEDVGALRRSVALLAERSGVRGGDAALVATELASNLLRHTTSGGHVLYRPAGGGIEFLAVDRGPGTASIDASAGSVAQREPGGRGGLGAGIAAVRRLATAFDWYSTSGGTVVLARLGGTGAPTGRWRWGGVNVPLGGSGPSGDGWAVIAGRRLGALLVDGLGHGPAAERAAAAALSTLDNELIDEDPSRALQRLVRRAHVAMRGTRGAVLGACVIDPEDGGLVHVGVGNTGARVVARGKGHRLPSRPGTLGTELAPPPLHLQLNRWVSGATLVMASDGISDRWEPADYPGLLRRDPAVIAATIHRDHGRATDDAAILVVQDTGTDSPAQRPRQ